jgi:DNA polymerase I
VDLFSPVKVPKSYYLVDNMKEFKRLMKTLAGEKCFAYDIETNHATTDSGDRVEYYEEYVDIRTIGISFAWGRSEVEVPWRPGNAAYIPLLRSDNTERWGDGREYVLSELKSLLENTKIEKSAHNGMFDNKFLFKEFGIQVARFNFDTMLAKGILDEDSNYCSHALKSDFSEDGRIIKLGCSDYFLDISASEWKKDLKDALKHYDPAYKRYSKVPLDILYPYACADTDLTLSLKLVLEKKLEEENLTWLFRNITMPFSRSILLQELNGIPIHIPTLNKFSQEQKLIMEESSKKVYEIVGKKFDIASPKQLGEILFDEFGIEGGQRNKSGGWVVDEEMLSKVDHPCIEHLMSWRKAAKLDSTYLEGNLKYIKEVTHDGEFGWAHPSYFIISKTGRARASSPNITNVPKPNPEEEAKTGVLSGGSIARGIYKAPEGYSFLLSDYSQQELRVAALVSQEPNWIEAFRNGEDLHSKTAHSVFRLPCSVKEVKDLYPIMRKNAKTVNFGILYGESPFGLSQSLGMDIRDANTLIEDYFKGLPGLKQSIDSAHEFVKTHGYLENMFGRRRHLPDAMIEIPKGIYYKFNEVPPCYRRTVAPFQIGLKTEDIFKVTAQQVSNKIYKKGLSEFNKCRNCPHLETCFINSEVRYLKSNLARYLRQAYNYLVQGGSADISVLAHTWVTKDLMKHGIDATIVAFIHDEFILLCRNDVVDHCKEILEENMVRKIMKLLNSNVEFIVDHSVKQCWADDV